ncbi:MAG: TraB/GumN family protein [Bdellovibrionota bacterium]
MLISFQAVADVDYYFDAHHKGDQNHQKPRISIVGVLHTLPMPEKQFAEFEAFFHRYHNVGQPVTAMWTELPEKKYKNKYAQDLSHFGAVAEFPGLYTEYKPPVYDILRTLGNNSQGGKDLLRSNPTVLARIAANLLYEIRKNPTSTHFEFTTTVNQRQYALVFDLTQALKEKVNNSQAIRLLSRINQQQFDKLKALLTQHHIVKSSMNPAAEMDVIAETELYANLIYALTQEDIADQTWPTVELQIAEYANTHDVLQFDFLDQGSRSPVLSEPLRTFIQDYDRDPQTTIQKLVAQVAQSKKYYLEKNQKVISLCQGYDPEDKGSVTYRNKHWAQKLDTFLQGKGNSHALVVVGLCHLYDPNGNSLLDYLRSNGYEVTPVQF